jgi:hypothetical protein
LHLIYGIGFQVLPEVAGDEAHMRHKHPDATCAVNIVRVRWYAPVVYVETVYEIELEAVLM